MSARGSLSCYFPSTCILVRSHDGAVQKLGAVTSVSDTSFSCPSVNVVA